LLLYFFFFTATPTTEIYTLSLHDALPISRPSMLAIAKNVFMYRELIAVMAWKQIIVRYKQSYFGLVWAILKPVTLMLVFTLLNRDRKSTRLNSSHSQISYAVFCLKKKKKK